MTTDPHTAPCPHVVTRARWTTRALDLLLFAVAVAMVFDLEEVDEPHDNASYVLLSMTWTVLATTFVLIRLSRMRRSRRPGYVWPRWLHGPAEGYLVVSTTIVMVGNALSLLRHYTAAPEPGADPDLVAYVMLSALALIVLSWGVLHLSYAERYARTYLRGRAAGIRHLAFPGTAEPTLSDFVYFAFSLGTTFTTPDVSVLTGQMRSTVTFHGLLAFLYSVVIVASTIGVLAR